MSGLRDGWPSHEGEADGFFDALEAEDQPAQPSAMPVLPVLPAPARSSEPVLPQPTRRSPRVKKEQLVLRGQAPARPVARSLSPVRRDVLRDIVRWGPVTDPLLAALRSQDPTIVGATSRGSIRNQVAALTDLGCVASTAFTYGGAVLRTATPYGQQQAALSSRQLNPLDVHRHVFVLDCVAHLDQYGWRPASAVASGLEIDRQDTHFSGRTRVRHPRAFWFSVPGYPERWWIPDALFEVDDFTEGGGRAVAFFVIVDEPDLDRWFHALPGLVRIPGVAHVQIATYSQSDTGNLMAIARKLGLASRVTVTTHRPVLVRADFPLS